MTPWRHRWKLLTGCAAKYLAMAGLLAGIAAHDLGAATTERIVTDRHTGLAIAGFDPVSYFIDGNPVAGRPEFELKVEQAVWRFLNEGNRAAFAERPDIYMPRFGGHDPIALARGIAVAGNPTIWRIEQERLYLFYSDDAVAAFDTDPDKAIAAADEHWPEVERRLPR